MPQKSEFLNEIMQTNENTCLEVHGDEADPVHEVVEPEDDSGEEEDEAGEEQEDVDHAEPLLVLAGPLSVHAQGRLGGLGPLERRHLEVASDPGCLKSNKTSSSSSWSG